MGKRKDATTVEHIPPAPETARRASPGLLVAFPSPTALPLSPMGEPIGRAWFADHGHVDVEISNVHLSFVRRGTQLCALDERSRNGVFIDGERLAPGEPVPITDGALIRVGRTLLVFRESVTKPQPAGPVGKLVGPWGLGGVRKALGQLHAAGARNVMIEGETGTGKELVAEAVAVALRRRDRFGVVNVAAVAGGVFEAQLFGWKRGAYSGSAEGGQGVLARHDGGAVFLDEIGELPLEVQPKLLRLLENREILAVGASAPTSVDVAIVAATNRDLDAMVGAGTFRRDLLARFDRRIKIPPLRDRAEDIFAILSAVAAARRSPLLSERAEIEAVERLLLHDWPGNVRELDSILTDLEPPGALTLRAVEAVLGRLEPSSRGAPLTREVVERALAASGGNQMAAAKKLGVSRGRLLRVLQKLR